jgi:glycosyltransferase 2 family protein
MRRWPAGAGAGAAAVRPNRTPADGAPHPQFVPPPGSRARRAFSVALLLLPLGVVGNLAYTFFGTDRALLAGLGELPRGYLVVALALTLVPWLTGTLRLLVWSRFLGCRLPFRELLRMTLVVDLGAAVSPTAIGGEAFRWGMLVQNGVRPGAAATLALLPKIEDAVFFLGVGLPFALVWTQAWRLPVVVSSARVLSENAVAVMLGAALLGLAAWLLLQAALRGGGGARLRRRGVRRAGRSRRRLRRGWRDARGAMGLILRRGKARLALTLTLTAAHWAGRYSVVAALMLFLGVPFDPVLFWLLQWVVFTFMSFVPTPGAAGGAEVAFTAVYAALLPAGVIGVATAAWRIFTFYVPVALAALVFVALTRSPGLGIRSPAAT